MTGIKSSYQTRQYLLAVVIQPVTIYQQILLEYIPKTTTKIPNNSRTQSTNNYYTLNYYHYAQNDHIDIYFLILLPW